MPATTMQSETVNLTVWEAKEQAGLLALETDEWREKRLIAEDPDTAADVLERFAEDAISARDYGKVEARKVAYQAELRGEISEPAETWKQGDLLLKSVVVHPNTPTKVLDRLIGVMPEEAMRMLCKNPATPYLLLEQPGFLGDLDDWRQHLLLKQADAPLPFVEMLTTTNAAQDRDVQQSAQFHVAFAGEVATREEWQQQITEYWRAECALPSLTIGTRQWHTDLAEMGLAPLWACGDEPPPAELIPIRADAALDEWFLFEHSLRSAGQTRLLRHMSLNRKEKAIMARGLGKDATPADMCALLQMPFGQLQVICHAVSRHPLLRAESLQPLQAVGNWYTRRKANSYAKALTQVLTYLLQSRFPDVRRMARRHPTAPADAIAISRAAFLRPVDPKMKNVVSSAIGTQPPMFGDFVAAVNGLCETESEDEAVSLHHKAERWYWTERLQTVLCTKPNDKKIPGDPYGRTSREILDYLTHDGNHLVRWAAQTRLADPNFVFTWADE